MIEDIQETPSTTPDFQAELAAQLGNLIPEAIVEGKVDVEKLKELLDGEAADGSERFGLSWPGKKRALRAAQEPTTATLRPDPENSKDWDLTQNVFIEGDNLEVLKILQKHYHAKVKMIYLDPPYNTGKDFVYPDNYKEGLNAYLEWTRQLNEEGKKLSTNAETEGRYHSNWLNMMYPRLKLARNLLANDGVIFISIDDNEVDNLKKLCNEVFGERNFVGCAGRITKKSNNKGDFWAPNFDYVLTYARNIDLADPFFGGVNLDAYNLTEEEGPRKGDKYQLVRLYMSTIQNRNPEQRFWIDCPDGQRVMPPGTTFPPTRPELGDGIWRWTRTKFEAERERIVIKPVRSSNLVSEDGSPARWNVFTKTYLQDVIDASSAKPNSFIEGHINQAGSHELRALGIPFDYSKPSSLIKHLMQISKVKSDDIVLDFFAGSSTTADAVMQLNAQDDGKRRFVMVQLPEPTPEGSEARKAGYSTISEISRERIRRAGAKIQGSSAGQLDLNDEHGDVGFRSYKLTDTNFSKWKLSSEVEPDALQEHLLSLRESSSADEATADALLTEILLKQGYSLTEAISASEIAGMDVRLVHDRDGDIGVLAYLNEHKKPTLDQLRAFVDKSPTRIIVLEDAFQGDDELKTNLTQLAKSKGIELWTA